MAPPRAATPDHADEHSPLVVAGSRQGASPTGSPRRSLNPVDDPAVLRAARRSIYSVETVAAVAEKQGLEAVEKLTSGFRALCVMAIIFFVAAIVGSLHPIVYSWALAHPVTGRKQDTVFIPYVQYIFYYAGSTIVGNLLAFLCYGKSSVKDCWYWKNLMLVIPASGTLAFVESIDGWAMARVQPALKNVMAQAKLPIITILSVFAFGRKQSMLQWALIAAVTISVMGYSIQSYQTSEAGKKVAAAVVTATTTVAPHLKTTTLASSLMSTLSSVAGSDTAKATMLVGIMLCLGQCFCSSIGTTISEFTFKHMKFPFFVQMAQTRFVSLVISCGFLVIYKTKNPEVPFLSGYSENPKLWILIVWLCLRDWTQTLCVKRLSALWKAMASGVSMCLTYVISVSRGIEAFDQIKMFFMLGLVTDILAYAFSRRETKKKEEAAKRHQALLDQSNLSPEQKV